MKKLVFIFSCCLFAVLSSAQTLDQKKICALKWTLQQTFYNKPEGQQIARLNVTEFKSFGEFQQNKLISDAIKKVTNPSDLSRVKSIIGATSDGNLASSVPAGAKREFQADLEKIKSVAPVETEDEVVEEEEPAGESAEGATEAPAPGIQTVEEVQDGAASGEADATAEDAQNGGAFADAGSVSWVEAVLIALGVYVILSLCVWLFVRSKKHGSLSEEMVSMEQYRAERVRLMERIKSVEIEMENLKAMKKNDSPAKADVIVEKQAKPAVKQPEVKQAEPVKPYEAPKMEERPEPAKEAPSLFSDPVVEPHEVVEPVMPIVEQPVARPKFSVVMFYPVPEDGMFVNGTTDIEPGKSLYMMKTSDNVHATFQILNTPEAIAAALVSMNDMVKPACKVLNTVADPVEILAEKLGTAIREGDGWRITNKAVVRLI